MHMSSRHTLLIALALGSSLSYGAGFAAPRAQVMVNPQPLPPRHFGPMIREAVNPQPLPPIDRKAAALPVGSPNPPSAK